MRQRKAIVALLLLAACLNLVTCVAAQGKSSAPGQASQGKGSAPGQASQGNVSAPSPASQGNVSAPSPANQGNVSAPSPANQGNVSAPSPASQGNVSASSPASQGNVSAPSQASQGKDIAPGQAMKIQKAVQGELVYVTVDDGEEQWAVRQPDGSLVPLDRKNFKPPKKDKDGKDFQPGTQIAMNCDITADGLCTPSPGTEVTPTRSGPVALPGVAASPVFQRLLVIIMDYPGCNMRPGINETAVRSVFLGPNGDGSGGVAQKYSQCSYGNFNLNATAFHVITVQQECSINVTRSCSWWTVSNGADMAAKAMLGATAFADFTHYAYVLPPAMGLLCSWAGLAVVPGKQIWLSTSSYGIYRWATIMQEALHNYGMRHSWNRGLEYDDGSTAMGNGDACLNAAEMSRLGWATPVAGGGAIDSTVLNVTGVAQSFVLPATYLRGNGNYLRVVPNWLSSYTNVVAARNLYIAVRVNKGPDVALASGYTSRVHVHEVNATMDNAPALYRTADSRIQIISRMAARRQANLTAYNLVVYGGSWVGTDTMRVHLCRYVTSPAECPTIPILEPLPPSPNLLPPRPPAAPPSPPPTWAPNMLEATPIAAFLENQFTEASDPDPGLPPDSYTADSAWPDAPSYPPPSPPSPPPPSPQPPSPPPPSPPPPSPPPPSPYPPSPPPPSPPPPSPPPPLRRRPRNRMSRSLSRTPVADARPGNGNSNSGRDSGRSNGRHRLLR